MFDLMDRPSGRKPTRMKRRFPLFAVLLAALLIAAGILLALFLPKSKPVSAIVPEPTPEMGPALPAPIPGELCVYVLDVGQGNAALLVSPSGKTILIDSGDAIYANRVSTFIRSLGVDSLDLVVATHPHADHVGGMRRLIEKFGAGEYVMPEVGFDDAAQQPVQELLRAKAIRTRIVWSGDTLDWDPDCPTTVLSPVLGCEYSQTDANDSSLILRVEFNGTSILFTGDATVHAEQLSMYHNERALFNADVLIVPHHGSTTSSSYGFLETVGAEIAIVSVGAGNSYGHPDFDILTRLANTSDYIYRTDLFGSIAVFMDGSAVRIAAEKRPDNP